jgi:NAD(P)-dependent dehydrogenase (short-subunit alcohol dehydrogenase family)
MSDFKVSFSLEGRVVVVTGGAQGIGQGVAVAAAGVGANVAVVDLDEAAHWRSASTSATATRSSPRSIASSPGWGASTAS